MVDAKSYLTTIVMVTCLIFVTTATINYIVDPYWQFDFAPSTTIFGVNDQISESSLSKFYPDLMLARQNKMVQQSSADIIFIGSSRSFFGLNTCGYNDVQKIGMFGITSSQTLHLLDAALNNNKVGHAYIELGSLINHSDVDSSSLTPLEALFSVHVLTRSLSNVRASLSLQGHKDPQCEVSRNSNSAVVLEGQGFEYELERYRSIYENLNSSRTAQVFQDIARQCQKTSRAKEDPLNIVIYLGPIHPSLIEYETLPNVNQSLKDMIYHHDFSEQCLLGVYTFEQHDQLYQNKNWFDVTHFKPAIGDIFLREILEANPNLPK